MTHHLPFSALPSARCACARAQEDGTVESERRALLCCAVQEEGNADVELRDAYRKSARKCKVIQTTQCTASRHEQHIAAHTIASLADGDRQARVQKQAAQGSCV